MAVSMQRHIGLYFIIFIYLLEINRCVSFLFQVQGTHWGSWSKCAGKCGHYGSQIRTKPCSPYFERCSAVLHTSSGIRYVHHQLRNCALHCAIDGQWSRWGLWSRCSVSCGDGKRSRQRTCNNPKPSGGGKSCSGSGYNSGQCSASCPTNGQWSIWGAWDACSASCGDGRQLRRRSCTSPAPNHGGKPCSGPNSEYRKCRTTCLAAVDGHWSRWGSWGTCNTTCGHGQQSRQRYCTNPPPSGGGKDCPGSDKDNQTCTSPCLTSPKWSDWTAWSLCDVSCGIGFHQRSRTCFDNLMQKTFAAVCGGQDSETSLCSEATCPATTTTTTQVTTTRTRVTTPVTTTTTTSITSTTTPATSILPSTAKTFMPTSTLSPIAGNWSPWISVPCTVTCGTGVQAKIRSCANPAPQNGGKDCVGSAMQADSCDTHVPCVTPVDGQWSAWMNLSCSVTCGVGEMTTIRSCNNPAPQHGGKTCAGTDTRTQKCNTMVPCVIDGAWSAWSSWSNCPVTCGEGFKERHRKCDNPAPQNGGLNCTVGKTTEKQTCTSSLCPEGVVICDKYRILNALATNGSVNHHGDLPCPDSNRHRPESLLEELCTAPSKSHWKFKSQVRTNCMQKPLYEPVGYIDTHTFIEHYGIFFGCISNGFKMVEQNCTHPTSLVNVVGQDAYDYRIISW